MAWVTLLAAGLCAFGEPKEWRRILFIGLTSPQPSDLN